jgi:hypothetical protein
MSVSYPNNGLPLVSNDVVTTVTATTTNIVLIPANLSRAPESLIINSSNKNMWVTFTGAAATAVSPAVKIPANGGTMDIPGSFTGAINAIWETGGQPISGTAAIHEFSYL